MLQDRRDPPPPQWSWSPLWCGVVVWWLSKLTWVYVEAKRVQWRDYTSRTKVALLEFFKITNPFPIESYMLHVVHVSEILRSDFHTYKPFNIIYLKGCGNLTVLYLPHKTHSQMWSVNDRMSDEPNTLRSINFIPFEEAKRVQWRDEAYLIAIVLQSISSPCGGDVLLT